MYQDQTITVDDYGILDDDEHSLLNYDVVLLDTNPQYSLTDINNDFIFQ